MPVVINMENCQFYDNASVIRYNNEIDKAQENLKLQAQNKESQELVRALDELKLAMNQKNEAQVKRTAVRFSEQFKSGLFANIASGALFMLVNGLLTK